MSLPNIDPSMILRVSHFAMSAGSRPLGLQPHRVAAIWRELVHRVQVALTHEDETPACHAGRPTDLGDRQFVATRPNQLWVSDFTDVTEPVLH